MEIMQDTVFEERPWDDLSLFSDHSMQASNMGFERKHVSKLVLADLRVLSPLLLAVAIVNSAVSTRALDMLE